MSREKWCVAFLLEQFGPIFRGTNWLFGSGSVFQGLLLHDLFLVGVAKHHFEIPGNKDFHGTCLFVMLIWPRNLEIYIYLGRPQ